jgi:TRAP-type mannitol/chloroaromatic compound transport system permease small subunit
MQWVDRLSEAIGRGVAWLYVVAVIATAYEVAARYLFNAPTIWAHELTVFLVAIAFLLGGTYTLAHDQHIRITALYDAMPAPVRKGLDYLSLIVTLLFLAGLLWASWLPAVRAVQRWETTGSAWDPPIPALLKPIIAITACLMTVQAAVLLARRLRGRGKGR